MNGTWAVDVFDDDLDDAYFELEVGPFTAYIHAHPEEIGRWMVLVQWTDSEEDMVTTPVDSLAEAAQVARTKMVALLDTWRAAIPDVLPVPVRKCRVCGCTDWHACAGGCYWVAADLCSRCKG